MKLIVFGEIIMKKIKSKIAMFNLNRKSTFRSTLLALMLALILGRGRLLGQSGGSPRAAIWWEHYIPGRIWGAVAAYRLGPRYRYLDGTKLG